MACGDLLAILGTGRMPLASLRECEPEDAAREALACYLGNMVFFVPSSSGTPISFKLVSTQREWANEDEDKDEPSASITVITNERQHHNFVPTFRDDSFDKYGKGTVLVKINERQIMLQIDFWTTNKPERQAIAAAMDEYFAPEEGRYGVMIRGPSNYWDEPIRFVLDSSKGTERLDSSESALTRDRRLLVRVIANVDDLQLRKITELSPIIKMQSDGSAQIEQIYPRPVGD